MKSDFVYNSGFSVSGGEEIPIRQFYSSNMDFDSESEQAISSGETPTAVLQDIAMKCGTKVEFRPALVASTGLQFSIETQFAGKKIGEGFGRTRREAQQQASECSIKKLAVFPADIYMSRTKSDSGNASWQINANNNGFLGTFGNHSLAKDESFSSASESSRLVDPRLDSSKKSVDSVSALKELCKMEGLGVAFQALPPSSSNSGQKDEVYAQVEIDGQVLGKGTGFTLDEAKMQAAEKALGSLQLMLGQFSGKRQGSPRSLQGMSSKRLKPEFPRVMQCMPSSAGRYPKNAPPVP
ncbi:hypothetical protein SLEP1_g52881 [Rubroshorea leprosula]|uniref:DRBM domain-containing protein n=1 Tax=Rubroshorea leprosula TaxID=152421 RepID=A0AAV5M7U3_9ROSI|nr:hypothetical protein SLEP1_g52881 [Rubroshorea leprosula]